jgi:hypothetical protein
LLRQLDIKGRADASEMSEARFPDGPERQSETGKKGVAGDLSRLLEALRQPGSSLPATTDG